MLGTKKINAKNERKIALILKAKLHEETLVQFFDYIP